MSDNRIAKQIEILKNMKILVPSRSILKEIGSYSFKKSQLEATNPINSHLYGILRR
jgi:hypothetical protein